MALSNFYSCVPDSLRSVLGFRFAADYLREQHLILPDTLPTSELSRYWSAVRAPVELFRFRQLQPAGRAAQAVRLRNGAPYAHRRRGAVGKRTSSFAVAGLRWC